LALRAQRGNLKFQLNSKHEIASSCLPATGRQARKDNQKKPMPIHPEKDEGRLFMFAIKQTRKERHLTQEELGKLIGVQKAQISRLENNASNVTMDTLIKVFSALKAKVKLQVELPNLNINVGQ
jgi:DNA-binding XRE family transcriptional regulator